MLTLYRGIDYFVDYSDYEVNTSSGMRKLVLGVYAYPEPEWYSPKYLQITAGFGGYNNPNNVVGSHMGVDYVLSENVKAIYGGTVVAAHYTKANGNVVVVEHIIEGITFYSFYSHLSSFGKGISGGAEVNAGDSLGIQGDTGERSSGIHLHLGIYVGARDTDPIGRYREGKKDAPAVKMPSEFKARGYADVDGTRFFDAEKVIATSGKIIVDSYR